MSYQYPPPPGEDSSPRSTNRSILPPVISVDQPQPQEVDRRESTSPTGRGDSLKRAASNDTMRGQSAAEASSNAAAEKRRNKLGYHRTSVACGHCRRRKIRCVIAQGDMENRCENCIRLKKDCNFYPVDAVPPLHGGRSPRGAMNGGKDTGRPLSGSPGSHIYAPSEANRGLPYMNLKHNMPVPSTTVPSARQYLDGPHRSVAPMYDQPMHEYPPPPASQWAHGDPTSAPRPQPDASYWRQMNPQEPPVTPGGFSAFQPDIQQLSHQQSWPSGPEAGLREDSNWSVPNRSIPYGSLGSVQPAYSQFSPSGQPINRDGLAPRSAGQGVAPYLRNSDNSPLNSSTNSDGANSDHSAIAAGPAQLPSFPPIQQGGFAVPPQPLGSNSYSKHPLSSSTEPYSNWYPPTNGLPSNSQGPQEPNQQASYGAGGPYGGPMYYDDGPR